MNPTFFNNNNTIMAVAGGESTGGANTLAYTVLNNDEPNVSFTRASSQFMSAPSTTYNIQTNGGFTAVARVRFMNTLVNERVFDFGPTGGATSDLISLTRGAGGTNFQAWIMNSTAFTGTLAGGTIVQNQWTNLVMRYISNVGFPKVAMTSDSSNGYISSTSGYFVNDPQYSSYRAFDLNSSTFWHSVEFVYSDSGVYTGSTSTTVGGSPVLGEWIQLQLPVPIQLVGFVLTPRTGFSDTRSPQNFVIAGTNDPNTGWTSIVSYSGQLFPTATPVSYTLGSPSTQTYQYYRMIVTVVGGGASTNRASVQIAEWSLQNSTTNTFQLYQNGTLVASQTVASPLTDRTLGLNYIGYNIANALYSSIDYAGLLVYDRALADAEISTCTQILTGSLSSTSTPSTPKFSVIARSLGLADGANVSSWGGFTQATSANQPVFWRRFNNWVGLGNSVFSTFPHDIKFARNRWVAAGIGTNTLAYSNDGITWTGLGTTIFSSGGVGVASSSTLWVAGGSGTTNSLAYSADGISWTGLGKSVFDVCFQTAWNPKLNRWVAVGHNEPVSSTISIAYSPDGQNWTIATSPFTSIGNYSAAYCVATAILSGGGTRWVVGGQNNGANTSLAYSTDGITWTGNGNSIFSSYCFGVAWNGSLWVAVGAGSTNSIATSSDGVGWTARGKPAGINTGRRVAWTGTYWIVAGEPAGGGNCLAISYDGVTWTGITRQGLFTTRALSVGSNFSVL